MITYPQFLAWEEVHAQAIMEALPDQYYTDQGYTPENSFRAVWLPDRWHLDMDTIRAEIEGGKIPVNPGWVNMGRGENGKHRLLRKLFVPNEFLAAREETHPQLKSSAAAWIALRAKLEETRQFCKDATTFYRNLPPSLSPEMNQPRTSSCPIVNNAIQRSRRDASNSMCQNAKGVQKSMPDAARWLASVEAVCAATVHVMESGCDWKKKDFLRQVAELYEGEGTPHSDAEEAAWKTLPNTFKIGPGNKSKKQQTLGTLDTLK